MGAFGFASAGWVFLVGALVFAGCGDAGSLGGSTFVGDAGTAAAGGAGGTDSNGGNAGSGAAGGNSGATGGGGAAGQPPDLPTSTDGPCTDGDDCLCDLLAGEPTILGCEDFEDPNLPNYGGRAGWHEKYGVGVNGCSYNPNPGSNTGYTRFGRSGGHCIDIVQEGDCEVPGQIDCVFGGARALDHRQVPGATHGITGSMRWASARRFGFTMALKFSDNYITPGTAEGSGPAHKMNEFGGKKHAIIGASTGQRNHPYGGSVLRMVPSGASAAFEAVVGDAEVGSTGNLRLYPDRNGYNWSDSSDSQPATHGPGDWICMQQHWDGWGTDSATVRAWMDGVLVLHVRNIDMTAISDDRDGIARMAFNNYYNGMVTDGGGRSGYPSGAGIAARYEDNIVVTSASEPVSCAVIGFEGLAN